MNKQLVVARLPLVLAIGCISQAWAADVERSDTMQVWGTQVKNSSLIGEQEIELKQADHLSDLLRDQPGVDIGGAHSVNQRINIRGLQDLDLEITIDGARQNNFMYHHMGNLLINADILKAVDIRLGTNSVINGGLGGGVAFETKDARDLLQPGQQLGARLHANYASNDYHGYSVTGYGQLNDALDFMAYFNRVDRDNPADGSGAESVGNDGTIDNALVKFGLDIDEANRLEISYDKYQDQGDYAPRPDMGVNTNVAITGDTVFPTEYYRSTLTLGYELDLGEALNLRATLYRNEMELWRDEALNSRASYRFKEGTATHTGLNLLAETVLAAGATQHTLRYGIDTYKQETELHEDAVFISGEEARSLALFLEDEIALAGGLRVTPGIRYNRYELDSNASDKTFTDTTWGLAAEYPLNEHWTLSASTTRLFKGPMLAEVFTDAGANLTPNPDLQPETGINNELGIAYSERGVLGLDKLSFGLTLFKSEIEDYIDDEGNGALANIGDYDLDGFEAILAASRGDLAGRLTYAKSESENQLTGEPLGRQVGDSISLGLDYALPRYDLTLNWSSLVTLEERHFDKDGYDVHSISARWTPKSVRGMTLTAGIENLFDEYYVSHASRIGDANHPVFGALHLNDYEPGRNVKLSVSYQF